MMRPDMEPDELHFGPEPEGDKRGADAEQDRELKIANRQVALLASIEEASVESDEKHGQIASLDGRLGADTPAPVADFFHRTGSKAFPAHILNLFPEPIG